MRDYILHGWDRSRVCGKLVVFEVSLRLLYMKILKCWRVQVDHINGGSLNQLAKGDQLVVNFRLS